MQDRPFPFARPRASIAAVPTDTVEAAFTTIVARHRRELHRHCAHLLKSPADAEDALQETLLRAWRSRRTFTGSSPRPWLYRIATHACFDLMARRTAHGIGDEPVAPPESQPDAVVLDREALELALLTAIQRLPQSQHTSFVMRDVLDWSADEAASALSTTAAASNSALQRARRTLRMHLAPGRAEWGCSPPCAAERRTLRRYLSAIEAPSTETAARFVRG
jgi:RNA polymerase sigma factor (sigma-70 family)